MPFDYERDFPAEDPNCVTAYEQTFSHTDWVDGVSVVQAEATPTEEGFNARFNKIQTDLEGLGTDNEKIFGCVADMRGDLRVLLDEIKTRLNQLEVFERLNSIEQRLTAVEERLRQIPLPTPPIPTRPTPIPTRPTPIPTRPTPIPTRPTFPRPTRPPGAPPRYEEP